MPAGYLQLSHLPLQGALLLHASPLVEHVPVQSLSHLHCPPLGVPPQVFTNLNGQGFSSLHPYCGVDLASTHVPVVARRGQSSGLLHLMGVVGVAQMPTLPQSAPGLLQTWFVYLQRPAGLHGLLSLSQAAPVTVQAAGCGRQGASSVQETLGVAEQVPGSCGQSLFTEQMVAPSFEQ